MKRHKAAETESIPIEDQTLKLVQEDVDESKQSIEEAAYYIGMKRQRYSHNGDALNDWLEAEKAVRENLD